MHQIYFDIFKFILQLFPKNPINIVNKCHQDRYMVKVSIRGFKTIGYCKYIRLLIVKTPLRHLSNAASAAIRKDATSFCQVWNSPDGAQVGEILPSYTGRFSVQFLSNGKSQQQNLPRSLLPHKLGGTFQLTLF